MKVFDRSNPLSRPHQRHGHLEAPTAGFDQNKNCVCSLSIQTASRAFHTFVALTTAHSTAQLLNQRRLFFLQAQLRIQELENLARTKVSQDFHKRTVDRLDQQIKAASSERSQGVAEVRRLTEELKEVNKKMEEAIKAVCPCIYNQLLVWQKF